MIAVSYCRVSTQKQAREGVSLDVQREGCLSLCAAEGWQVAGEYTDDDSAWDPRAAYMRLLADAAAHRFALVVCWRYDRFGRNIEEAPHDVGQLERLGVRVVSVLEPNATRLSRNLAFLLADNESHTISQRVRPAHMRLVQDGFWVSKPPVGYRLIPSGKHTTLEVDPEMGPKVRALFDLFATGNYSLNMLMREADKLGLRVASGRPLARSSVRLMLLNPVYIGQVVYGRESSSKFSKKGPQAEETWTVAQGLHPALVSPETFTRCAEVLAGHKKAYGHLTGGRPLLTGLVYCGVCGARMVGRGQTRKRGKTHDQADRYPYLIYRCTRYIAYRDCANATYHGGTRLEQWVQAQLRRLPLTEEAQADAIAAVKARQRSGKNPEARLRKLREKRAALEEDRKAVLWNRVRDQLAEEDYRVMLTEVDAKRAQVDAEIGALALESRAGVDEGALVFLRRVSWDDFDRQAWKEALAVLVGRVVVTGRREWRIEWKPGVEGLLREEG